MTSIQYTHCQPGLLLETVGDDQEMFIQLTDIFMRESVDKCALLHSFATTANYPQLAFQSHSLKGTVGPLGADALVRMLIDLEEECDQGRCARAEERVSAIEEEIGHVRREMQHFLAGL